MKKNHLIIGGAVLVGLVLVGVYLNKKKKSVNKQNETPSTTVEEADATYMANESTPEFTDGFGHPFSFNERIGIYMPKAVPEMSMDNQSIDLTV